MYGIGIFYRLPKYSCVHYLFCLYIGDVPYDGYPQNSIDEYNIVLLVIYNMMTVAGVKFAIVCSIFNFIFRKKKYSKNYFDLLVY